MRLGVSYGIECYCSSSTPTSSAKTADSECQMKCGGSSTTTCGDAWRLNVYSIGDTPVATPTTTTKAPTTTSAAATGTAVALGCYLDNGSNRVMSYSADSSSSMTPSLCQSECRGKGYDYAGEHSGVYDCECRD